MMPSWTHAANEVERLMLQGGVDAIAVANALQFIEVAKPEIADCDLVSVNGYMNSVCLHWMSDFIEVEVHAASYEVYRLNTVPFSIREFVRAPDEAISDAMMELLPKR